MRLQTAAAVLLFACAYATAQEPARKPCEDLKADISKKLEAKGVTSYSLDVVDKGKESAGAKVVGNCDGGTKSIVYIRTVKSSKNEPADEKEK